jgi:integrase
MQKTGTPWFRKGTNSWYVWHEGRQVPLAKGRENKAEAYARFAELLSSPLPKPDVPSLTVAGLVGEYEQAIEVRVQDSTLKSYRCVLARFTKEFGTRHPDSIDPAELIRWTGRMNWSSTTRRYTLAVANSVYVWATKAKKLGANPLQGMVKPPGKSRGAEVLITPNLHEQILRVSSPEFRIFLTAVRATGARPGEVAKVEAKDVQWEASCWVLTEHKTAKTGRVRTIYLPEPILAMCRELAVLRPVGPLFLNTRGEPWRKTGWKQAMERAQRKLGLTRRPLTSGYRHTFATDALEVGVPDTHVAELLGHSSTAMIFKHYGHLTAKGQTLRRSLERVRVG